MKNSNFQASGNADAGVTNTVTFSKITAKKPDRLAKLYRMDAAGALVKEPGGALFEGFIETKIAAGLRGFAAELNHAGPDKAFVYGVCEHAQAVVTTQGNLERMKTKRADGDLPVIARDRIHLKWLPGPGILMIDYDPLPGMPVLTKQELLELAYKIWPELRGAPHGWRPSSSSCIYNAETGAVIHDIRGQRLYVVVADGTDISRAGNVLFQRLWQAGHGAIVVSKSGAMLVRADGADASVWTPERLDFCGGAVCEAPLVQDLPDMEMFNPDEPPIDTLATLPDLSEKERAEVLRLQREAKGLDSVVKEAEAKVDAWVEERVQEAVTADPKADKERVRQSCRRAATQHDLDADFRIKLESGAWVTVAEIRDNPTKFHGMRCADPLEPDYGNDPRIGLIVANCSTPHIFSHAHGGQQYSLLPTAKTIHWAPGQLHEVVRQVLATIRRSGLVYERGGELVMISKDAAVTPLSAERLTVLVSSIASLARPGKKGNPVIMDCPLELAKRVLSMRGEYDMPKLHAVVTAPIMTLDGRILDQSGYDAGSKLLMMMSPSTVSIPRAPTLQQVIEALDFLLWPFKDFPFTSPRDVAVLLSTLITAVMRPVLPTAPGFLMTATTPGSGKTLLTESAAVLSGADEPSLMPPSDSEEEVRKRMLAAMREGKPTLILDNLVGQLDSATLCVLLTSRTYSDRVLGSSATVTVPTNALIMASGNNVTLVGDLNRRFLRCEIDPKMAKAYRRVFPISPAEYVRQHRQEMVAAALTLIHGYRTLGAPVTSDRTASFEDWSDLVRQPVMWLGQVSGRDLPDPCDSFDASYDQDPESRKLQTMLEAWAKVYGHAGMKVQQVIRDLNTYGARNDESQFAELLDAVDEIAGERGVINPRRLGRWIEKFRGRICGGFRFVIAGQSGGSNLWSVEHA